LSHHLPPTTETIPAPTEEPSVHRWLRPFASLRYRDYRLLWIGSLFSSSGLWIQQVSVGWITYEITGSALMLGIVNGFRSLPLLFFAPFGGVVADRLEPKRLMLSTQLFLVTVTAVFATVVLTGQAQVWNIILFSLLTGVAWAFNLPVRNSVVPSLVPRPALPTAIALNSVGRNITRVIGPSVGGLLIAAVGVAGNFYLQSLAYVGVATMVVMTNFPPVRRAPRNVSVLGNLAEGGRYVWRHPTLRTQMMLALVPSVVAMPYNALMPIFAEDILHVGPEGYGALLSAAGLGAFFGTFVVASLGDYKRKGRFLFGSILGFGISLILFAQSQSFIASLILLALVGACSMTYMTINQTLLQLSSSDEFRGRVMGIYMLDQGLVPLGSLLAGMLAEVWGAPAAVAVMGGSVVLLCAVSFALMPALREV
jgi:MFS transporter, DHA1 family, staphyloferrin A biosynthesis exporter